MHQPEGETVPDTTLSVIWTYAVPAPVPDGGADAASDAADATASDATTPDAGVTYESCWHNYVVRRTRLEPWRDASF